MESIACPKCSEIFPLYLFEFGIPFRCSCGVILASAEPPTKKRRRRSIRRPALPRQLREELVQEEVKVGQLRRWADRISFLIVASDFAEYEIEMEKRALRQWCRTHFPDRMELYDRVFEARFQRLWQQFRKDRK